MAGSREPRIYPIKGLTEEQVAVTFAMTSRQPDSFDMIAQKVTETKAADFHERWVLGYGHNSVAEHAVLHLAVENISRMACDDLEDNRLGAYTEKSSRYQLLDGYRIPPELEGNEEAVTIFTRTCDFLFRIYNELADGCIKWLKGQRPQEERETDRAYLVRLRREAVDSCRLVLPAATLTNVGVTMNARTIEHAISKLLSHRGIEMQQLGQALKDQAQSITPTLVKYAQESNYLTTRYDDIPKTTGMVREYGPSESKVQLIGWDTEAERRILTSLLFRQSNLSYTEVWASTFPIERPKMAEIIGKALEGIGDHDSPPREFESIHYSFDMLLDYGAYREYKRHRMQTYIPQAMTTVHGFRAPRLIHDAHLAPKFYMAMGVAEESFSEVAKYSPLAAQYLVTHAHYRRVLMTANLRELYHLFKLRTSRLAHFSIREPMLEAMKQVVAIHPMLFQGLKLRDYPEWWDAISW